MNHSFVCILLYIATAMFFYLLISACGLIWFKWAEIVYSQAWNTAYWLLIGWWLPILVVVDFDEKHS